MRREGEAGFLAPCLDAGVLESGRKWRRQKRKTTHLEFHGAEKNPSLRGRCTRTSARTISFFALVSSGKYI